jgi:hypothetical protein
MVVAVLQHALTVTVCLEVFGFQGVGRGFSGGSKTL